MTNPTTRSEVTRATAQVFVRILPFTTTLSALLAGIVIGAVARGWLQPPERSIEYVESASLAPLLQQECAPLLAEIDTQLGLVERDLERATIRNAAEERRIASFTDSPATEEDLAHAKTLAEIDYLRRVHRGLNEQKARIRERLVSADEQVAEDVALSDVLREPTTGELVQLDILDAWLAFLSAADREVCGEEPARATRDCQAALYKDLAAVRGVFVACKRKGGAPALARADGPPPEGAIALSGHHPKVRGWHVSPCSP